ncbi:MAG TPA: bifunctional 5,10-methylenetetrahydrofolate dehydrogenase/5,10-methenyltetrahydrofolate cyclohydrolase [Candidatus Gastranaerophilaceae bacterium]|nr:bifunctional 5,10-methylenetetrahydrofolate dehydrogenase/5,10-methenyltetrahydrofolate cyclohydrolase [Candidatus Gastranaerophilaceae bacterium]HPT41437.1 bifunctional 5,10-methylenetetrahydrofolate dehydrogenase/5,10-methenyltetrahydrofolate cyclohydrolase [Candidatus Gastranaerophilaceae bacterium]
MAIILDGKKLSEKILHELEEKISNLDKKPSFAVILVGNDPASELYVNIKEKKSKLLGINFSKITYPENIDEKTLLKKIEELNKDDKIDAMLVQMPLPKHINAQNIIQAISPKKDADGITPENIGRISIGAEPFAYPCTPLGIVKLLEEYKIELQGKHAVIIGRSNIVGKPLAQMLLNKNATVTICHSKTKNLSQITKTADILISAIGSPKFVKKDMVKQNATVIDVGTSKSKGKTLGDVDFENVLPLSSYITPVPGGVGPMTIACLMKNVLEISRLRLY